MTETIMIGEKEAQKKAKPEAGKTSEDYESEIHNPFDRYTHLKVELADDGLLSNKRQELLQELAEEENKLAAQGLIPPDRTPRALFAGLTDAELAHSIDNLRELNPRPWQEGETQAQALARAAKRAKALGNKLPEDRRKKLLADLEREQAEREMLRQFQKERNKASRREAGQKREEKNKEMSEKQWRLINLLKTPVYLRREFEEKMVAGISARAAVEKAVKEKARLEAETYFKFHRDAIAPVHKNEPDGGLSKMAEQLANGVPLESQGAKDLAAVIFFTFRALDLPEEKAIELAGEAIGHSHLKGIGKTEADKPEMDAVIQAAREHISHFKNPIIMQRYGQASAKQLYNRAKELLDSSN